MISSTGSRPTVEKHDNIPFQSQTQSNNVDSHMCDVSKGPCTETNKATPGTETSSISVEIKSKDPNSVENNGATKDVTSTTTSTTITVKTKGNGTDLICIFAS